MDDEIKKQIKREAELRETVEYSPNIAKLKKLFHCSTPNGISWFKPQNNKGDI